MCIYIIYYYSPFLYINITLYTKKRRKFSPCPCLTAGVGTSHLVLLLDWD